MIRPDSTLVDLRKPGDFSIAVYEGECVGVRVEPLAAIAIRNEAFEPRSSPVCADDYAIRVRDRNLQLNGDCYRLTIRHRTAVDS